MSSRAACASLTQRNRLPRSSGSAGERAMPPPDGETCAMAREALSFAGSGVKTVCALMTGLFGPGEFHPNALAICLITPRTEHYALCMMYLKYRGNVALNLFRRLF